MKEIRKCTICQIGEFSCKITSNRKTCCTECSTMYIDKYRKKLHGSLYELRKKSKILKN